MPDRPHPAPAPPPGGDHPPAIHPRGAEAPPAPEEPLSRAATPSTPAQAPHPAPLEHGAPPVPGDGSAHAAARRPHHAAPAHPAAPRAAVTAGDALYLSATLLSSIWAVVLLFVVYPQSPVDAGYADDDVPVMSMQGSVVTVKRAALEEALASHAYVAASREQVEYFEARRAATVRDVKRDKLFWYLAAAAFPGVSLLLFRLWYRALRRG